MERIRQELRGYKIPAYVEDILTGNYCPGFMRMSMIREKDNYTFSYRPGAYRRLEYKGMSLYEKLILIRTLITLSEKNKEYLIKPETYLIEPELVYLKNRNVSSSDVQLMYYPDTKSLNYRYKLLIFADRIINKDIQEEKDALELIMQASEAGDINRIKLTLDKLIMRYENRMSEGRIFS